MRRCLRGLRKVVRERGQHAAMHRAMPPVRRELSEDGGLSLGLGWSISGYPALRPGTAASVHMVWSSHYAGLLLW
ncbi:Hypothetical protein MexAM1_p2METAp0034 (plasmid) [Methylorubrum extorquens AM1]|uniref:Uncharacterized protein n=1 Tax=Methylorubrum extorquens (strain ATCC 14718 / DSM 1338 / JCM 2805 / NCIMB 9133 / AM1) TaxID=272630 RepID=C5B6T7_METEA|nr:Hypothetical protein MexAM1_p2METAp0034 [Methylorubrum extorquens AM1]